MVFKGEMCKTRKTRAVYINAVFIGESNPIVLHDFADCLDKKIKVNKDYKDKYAFFRKCWQNIANAGRFSSDRTVLEYAKEIWKIK